MTPKEEKGLQDWYWLEFHKSIGSSRTLGRLSLLDENPEDWKRMQIWDGKELVSAMPEGFRGKPTPEQIAHLQTAAKEGRLFMYALGKERPCQYDMDKHEWVEQPSLDELRRNEVKQPVDPVDPGMFTQQEPELETYTANISQSKLTLNKWFGWLGVCSGEKRKLEQQTAQYNADHAAWAEAKKQHESLVQRYKYEKSVLGRRTDEYQVWLNQVQQAEQREAALETVLEANTAKRREAKAAEDKENTYRETALDDIKHIHRLEQMDHTMDAIFAPRPKEVNPVVAEKKGADVSMDRGEFAELVSHGYDLPENCKFTPREAASINLLVSGATSVTKPVIDKMNPFNPHQEYKSEKGYNMIVTGLFGVSRHSQEWVLVHAGFDAAKEAIQAYQDGNPKILGGYLGDGLRNLVNGFDVQAISKLDFTSGGLVMGRVLEVLDKHPDLLANSGLTEKELRDARGLAALGEISFNGMKARDMLQQADAGLRELTPKEKGQCMADLTLLNLAERAIETERQNYNNSPENQAEEKRLEETVAEAMVQKQDFIKNHKEELEKNFKQVYPNYPDLGDSKSNLDKKYDMVYGAPANLATAVKTNPLTDFQNALGRKGALEKAQNGYRNDPQLQSVAARLSPKDILNITKNPKELGKELGKMSAQKQQAQKVAQAPVQKKVNTVDAPEMQSQQQKQAARMSTK